LLINDTVIVELKAIEHILPVHEAQLLTKIFTRHFFFIVPDTQNKGGILHEVLKKPQGLLINFFVDNIAKTAKPFVNEYFNALPEF